MDLATSRQVAALYAKGARAEPHPEVASAAELAEWAKARRAEAATVRAQGLDARCLRWLAVTWSRAHRLAVSA